MNFFLKIEINALAALFYKMQGYHVKPGYDFSKASHPTEKLMWEQAKWSHAFWSERLKP